MKPLKIVLAIQLILIVGAFIADMVRIQTQHRQSLRQIQKDYEITATAIDVAQEAVSMRIKLGLYLTREEMTKDFNDEVDFQKIILSNQD